MSQNVICQSRTVYVPWNDKSECHMSAGTYKSDCLCQSRTDFARSHNQILVIREGGRAASRAGGSCGLTAAPETDFLQPSSAWALDSGRHQNPGSVPGPRASLTRRALRVGFAVSQVRPRQAYDSVRVSRPSRLSATSESSPRPAARVRPGWSLGECSLQNSELSRRADQIIETLLDNQAS